MTEIKFSTDIIHKKLWSKKFTPEQLKVFFTIVFMAANGGEIETTYEDISYISNVSHRKTRRTIDKLRVMKVFKTERLPRGVKITVLNWERFKIGGEKKFEYATPERWKEFIDSFNRIRKANVKGSDKVRSKLNARLKDGYTMENIKDALMVAVQDEFHVKSRFRYLTPEFILRADKLDTFLNFKKKDKYASYR